MLNIYFGDMPEAVYNTSVYFNYTYEDEWLTSDFAKEVIKKIDKSNVLGPHAIESPVLGVIPPENLSGGTKTLLLMANDPEKVFNASTCGDNCAPFILKLAKKKDLTINLRHEILSKTGLCAGGADPGHHRLRRLRHQQKAAKTSLSSKWKRVKPSA